MMQKVAASLRSSCIFQFLMSVGYTEQNKPPQTTAADPKGKAWKHRSLEVPVHPVSECEGVKFHSKMLR